MISKMNICRPKCQPNKDNSLERIVKFVDATEEFLKAKPPMEAKNFRARVLKSMEDFFVFGILSEIDKKGKFIKTLPNDGLVRKDYNPLNKSCLIEWGREHVDEIQFSDFIGIEFDVEKAEDCAKPCTNFPSCVAWSYDNRTKECYLKSQEMTKR